MTGPRCARRLALLALLLAVSSQQALAGLVIANDNSDLCNSNLQDCTSRCAPPQSFLFTCDSGGTFSKPQSDCKCTSPPPADVVTDGAAVMQLVQYPGKQACNGQTWMYDCARFINIQALMNSVQANPVDEASAMAAVAAQQAAAQAAAAAAAAAATQAAAVQAGAQAADDAAAMPGSMPEPIPNAGADMNVGMGPAPATYMPGNMPGSSLMSGRRHLLQAGVLGAGPMPTAAAAGAIPTTGLSAACSKPIQGVVTSANGGLMAIPQFKGVANFLTRGNDTMFVQLGGQGSSCVAAYRLMTGQIMNIGRPPPGAAGAPVAAPAPKSGAGSVAAASGLSLLAALLLALLL